MFTQVVNSSGYSATGAEVLHECLIDGAPHIDIFVGCGNIHPLPKGDVMRQSPDVQAFEDLFCQISDDPLKEARR